MAETETAETDDETHTCPLETATEVTVAIDEAETDVEAETEDVAETVATVAETVETVETVDLDETDVDLEATVIETIDEVEMTGMTGIDDEMTETMLPSDDGLCLPMLDEVALLPLPLLLLLTLCGKPCYL